MIYVISDIHGCYNEYKKLLEKINFNEEDELFVLGDVVDRGPEPMKVLLDMMLRPNVYPIIGNHDYMALTLLSKLNVEITEENVESQLSGNIMEAYMYWIQDGGKTTVDSFKKLNKTLKKEVLEYLKDFSLYEEVIVNGKTYILVHADLHGCEEEKDLEEYTLADLIFYRADYTKRYFKDENTFLITGHTPTRLIHGNQKSFVYEENGHIAIDCGCVYGDRLAAYCLDNGKVEYVEKEDI